MDRAGVRQVSEGSGEQGKREETGCEKKKKKTKNSATYTAFTVLCQKLIAITSVCRRLAELPRRELIRNVACGGSYFPYPQVIDIFHFIVW